MSLIQVIVAGSKHTSCATHQCHSGYAIYFSEIHNYTIYDNVTIETGLKRHIKLKGEFPLQRIHGTV